MCKPCWKSLPNIPFMTFTFDLLLKIFWILVKQRYSKTCVKRPLSKKTKIGFQDQLSHNAGQKYCRMQYFRHSWSYHLSLRPLFCLFLSLPFYTGLTVCYKLHIICVFRKHFLLFDAFKFTRMPPGAVMNFENPQTPQAFPNPVSPASSYGGTMASVAPKNDLG